MIRDDDTLPEPRRAALIRAGFASDDADRPLTSDALGNRDERLRVLALRASARAAPNGTAEGRAPRGIRRWR